MNAIGQLIKALTTKEDNHEALLRYRAKLEWASQQFRNSEEDYPATLQALLLYDKAVGHPPHTFLDLKNYVEKNTEFNQDIAKQTEIILSEIDTLEDDDDPVPSDVEALMLQVFRMGVTQYDVITYQLAAIIAGGQKKYPRNTDETGPGAAQVWLSDRKAKRMEDTPKGHGGDLVENITVVNNEVDAYLDVETAASYRIKTGFKHIDDKTLIGPKHQRWIGILGYLNHGKSGFLMSMLYNMARDGANVLFVPREFSVMDAWQRFLWMHGNIFPELPAMDLHDWKRGGKVGMLHWRAKEAASDHLKNGGLAGSLDVRNFATWPEIEDYIKMRSYKKPVDVLAVDYIGHLDVEGRDQVAELNKVFRKAQLLTQNGIHNDGNGMVVITPLQANKKHYEAAAGEENAEKWGMYQSAAAVDYFSQAARDMDCLIGVWSEGTLVAENPKKMLVYPLKARGEWFSKHTIEIHEPSRYYRDLTDRKKMNGEVVEAAEVVANMADEEIADMLGDSKPTIWEDL